MKNILFLTLMFLFGLKSHAQHVFVKNAKVTYEKKLNLKRMMSENDWISDDTRDQMAKYKITQWIYSFNDSISVYKARKKESDEEESQFSFLSTEATQEMYTDFKANKRVFKKNIMGEDFILKDSIPKIKWKMMRDVRKIAGYECRKAIGVIHDSVYVVAFYTDDILIQGGPEGFTGLPGLILGLAIPQFNSTWFATKVDYINVPIFDISAPTKGKSTDTEKDFKKMIDLMTRYEDKKNPTKLEVLKKRIYDYVL